MNHCTKEELITFERRIADLWEAGELPFLIHLSGGNEEQLIEIFREVQPGDWIFSSHRNHYHYLLAGGSVNVLEAKIRRGDSMFVFGRPKTHGETDHHNWYECHPCARDWLTRHPEDETELRCAPEVHFVASSILAGVCSMAAGVAWDLKISNLKSPISNRVWCFLGDGAEDEGHFYEAVRFVHGHQLPCRFIIEDNDRQVESTRFRRFPGCDAFGLEALFPCVRRYHYTPTYPHAGSGCKHHIQFKPEAVRRYLESQGGVMGKDAAAGGSPPAALPAPVPTDYL